MREKGSFSSHYISYSNYLDNRDPYDSCSQVIGILARNKKYANFIKGQHGDGASLFCIFEFVQFLISKFRRVECSVAQTIVLEEGIEGNQRWFG